VSAYSEVLTGLDMLTFEVPGTPAGQGAHRVSSAGRIYEVTKNHRPWREAIIYAAREAFGDRPPITGPVEVAVVFAFTRPRSHYGSGKNATVLKPTAPLAHVGTPDLDHLQRSIGDALEQAGVVRNDKQIAQWMASKVYAERPSATVQLLIL